VLAFLHSTSCGKLVLQEQLPRDVYLTFLAGRRMINFVPNDNHGKRHAGRPRGSGNGRIAVSKSITMTPAAWALVDQLRGESSRGSWLSACFYRQVNSMNIAQQRAAKGACPTLRLDTGSRSKV
jgi:hypothetical protein